jgi:hypothetical protein
MSVNVVEKLQDHNPVSQRCDKCGARGYMVAEKGTLMLVFCNHHGQEAWKNLNAQGFEVTIIPLD